jgi:ribokinase
MIPDVDVLCIGDLDMDLLVTVSERPGADEKLSGRRLGLMPGGMAANTAVALARLGRSVRLLAAIGDDQEGETALASVASEGVDVSHVARRAGANTFMCIVLLAPAGEKTLIRLETDAYLPRLSDLTPASLAGVRHVHLTYGNPELTARAIGEARRLGLSTSLDLEVPDLKRAPQDLPAILANVDVLFLNRAGWDAIAEIPGTTPAQGPAGPGAVVVTLGAEGSRQVSVDGVVEIPGFPAQAVDTTGAGDCFAAAYLARMLEGASVPDRLRFANAAAALSTQTFGPHAGMPHRAAVETLLDAGGVVQPSAELARA